MPFNLVGSIKAAGPWTTLASMTANIIMSLEKQRLLRQQIALLKEISGKLDSIDSKCTQILTKLDELSEKIDVVALKSRYNDLDDAMDNYYLIPETREHYVITDAAWLKISGDVKYVVDNEKRISFFPCIYMYLLFSLFISEGAAKKLLNNRAQAMVDSLDKTLVELEKKVAEAKKELLTELTTDQPNSIDVWGILKPEEWPRMQHMVPYMRQFIEPEFSVKDRFVTLRHNFNDDLDDMKKFEVEVDFMSEKLRQQSIHFAYEIVQYIKVTDFRWYNLKLRTSDYRITKDPFFKNLDAGLLDFVPYFSPHPTSGHYEKISKSSLVGFEKNLPTLTDNIYRYNAARISAFIKVRITTIKAAATKLLDELNKYAEARTIRELFKAFISLDYKVKGQPGEVLVAKTGYPGGSMFVPASEPLLVVRLTGEAEGE